MGGDDVGGIRITTTDSPTAPPITNTIVDEGSRRSLWVRLSAAPNSFLTTIPIRVSLEATGFESQTRDVNITDGINSLINTDGTSNSRRLEFDRDTWDERQEIVIIANLDDDVSDGAFDIVFTAEVGSSIQSNYNLINRTVVLSHTDQTSDDPSAPDENLVYLRREIGDTLMGSLDITQEEETVTSYYVSLSHRPSADVTVSPVFRDPDDIAVSISPGTDVRLRSGPNSSSPLVSTLTFTPRDYDIFQEVYIHTSEDPNSEDIDYLILHRAQNGGYTNRSARVNLTVEETLPAELILAPTSLTLDEGGSTRVYEAVLTVDPEGEITVTIFVPIQIPVTIAKSTDGNTPPSDAFSRDLTLTFDSSDFNIRQTVYVRPDVSDSDLATNTGNISHTIGGTVVYNDYSFC